MAISALNTYNTVSENVYTTQKKQVSKQEKTRGTTTAKESKISHDEYLQKLQKQVKDLTLEIGSGLSTKKDNMVGAVTINLKLLEKMQNDPKAEKEYTQMLQGYICITDIAAAKSDDSRAADVI